MVFKQSTAGKWTVTMCYSGHKKMLAEGQTRAKAWQSLIGMLADANCFTA